jgi:S-adenosylmethionine hydrolase
VADLTHNIPDYDIWVGGYRLFQTANYWPEGTVFVSVIDPGVGTTRKSVVLKTKAGRYFVGPDNGQFTLIAERDGVAELREIDEEGEPPGRLRRVLHLPRPRRVRLRRRTPGLGRHQLRAGRPGAAGRIRGEDPYQKAVRNGDTIRGIIPVLDVKYGNVWTNIPALFEELKIGVHDKVQVRILHKGKEVNKWWRRSSTPLAAWPKASRWCT